MSTVNEMAASVGKTTKRNGYQVGDDLALFLHSTLNLTIFTPLHLRLCLLPREKDIPTEYRWFGLDLQK
jgi:hypothetical protein